MAPTKRKKQRYEKLEDILKLALAMQNSWQGLTIPDMQERFGVSRRTAERMRDAVFNVFGRTTPSTDDAGRKLWKLPPRALTIPPTITAEELSQLESSIKSLKASGRRKDAKILMSLGEKVRTWIKPENIKTIAVDFEALTEAEGIASRPRPKQILNDQILSDLRSAVLAQRKVRIDYYARSRDGKGSQTVHPYGFVHGRRHYLVAWSEKNKEMRYFTLSNIISADTLEKHYDPIEFSIDKYSNKSFGVYQEDKTYNVVWKFSKKAAKDAAEFVFHPPQETEKLKDGSIVVSFKACGLLEMVWHLFTWGSEVKIIEPKELRTLYKECVGQLVKVAK